MARPVFLSYAWEDEALADRVEAELRLRGVPVWRDRRGMRWGAYNEEVVLTAIEQQCSGFVLLLTDAVLASRFILDIELPAMARRRIADPSFFAGAIFAREHDVPTSVAELHAASGVELGAALGSPLSAEDHDADLRHAANSVLRAYLRTALAQSESPTARLETRSVVPEGDPAHLHLSWSPPLLADADAYHPDVARAAPARARRHPRRPRGGHHASPVDDHGPSAHLGHACARIRVPLAHRLEARAAPARPPGANRARPARP